MKINLDYKQKEGSEMSNQELTFDYITFAVNQKHKDGLSGSERRMFGRIQRKFDEAVEKLTNTVDLEMSEMDFIRDAFRDAKFPPQLAKYVTVLEDELMATLDKEEPASKPKK